jgi:hypothetical protein
MGTIATIERRDDIRHRSCDDVKEEDPLGCPRAAMLAIPIGILFWSVVVLWLISLV